MLQLGKGCTGCWVADVISWRVKVRVKAQRCLGASAHGDRAAPNQPAPNCRPVQLVFSKGGKRIIQIVYLDDRVR